MIGLGSPDAVLTPDKMYRLCAEYVGQEMLPGKRVLAIIPDRTRSAPIGVMFRILYDLLAEKPGGLDIIIALGTHPPMDERAIDQRLGLAPGERAARFPNCRVFNHSWKDPQALAEVGTLGADVIQEISGGLMEDPVRITINRRVLDYDALLIVGPTFPHEVVGFSGGNKYLFPGVSGQEIIDMFHWLGALITNPRIIGKRHTPVRAIIDRAAALVPVRRHCMSLVVKEDGAAGLFCGSPEEAWSAAADLSDRLHICYKQQPFRQVLSCAPTMYDELWVGGKAVYKIEPVVADDGELIVYAPHIRKISVTHGHLIEQVGYHVRDYFVSQMERFMHIPKGVLAHSTHVKGIGRFQSGVEQPRMRVILATGIPQETCRRINLGYRDPATIDIREWQHRETDGILHVPKAGEVLFRLSNDPFI